MTIAYTVLNWGNRKTIPTTDTILRAQQPFDEHPNWVDLTTPRWFDPGKSWVGTEAINPIEVISGEMEYKQILRLQTKHTYLLDVKKNSLIKENTYYYPGWTVKVNK